MLPCQNSGQSLHCLSPFSVEEKMQQNISNKLITDKVLSSLFMQNITLNARKISDKNDTNPPVLKLGILFRVTEFQNLILYYFKLLFVLRKWHQ
jgi:hypothetical protein